MKFLPSWLYGIVPVIVAGALAGCANRPGPMHQERPAGAMHGGASSGSPGNSMTGQMSAAERQEMCDMHRRMLGAKTYEEQRAMMSDSMRQMSQEEVDRRIEMMRSECR